MAKRQITIKTPLGDDELLIVSMRGTEQLGRLYQFELELYSRNEEINIDDILGQKVTLYLETHDGGERSFSGFVSTFSQTGRTEGGYASYQATLRPWLWFLTRTADCRIFQEKKVPEIIEEVFGDHGFSDFENALNGTYRTWEYCVQYRETDFNFVSRLMEQEGIYYYFKHQEDKQILVLSDDYSSHEPIDNADLPYYPPSDVREREEHVSEWLLRREIQPGAYALNDFDFEKPNVSLRLRQQISRNHAESEYEVYDYPGEYIESGDGDLYAQKRIEELQVQFEQVNGQTDARSMMTGGLFNLNNYPRDDQNREYLLISCSYDLYNDEFSSGGGSSAPVFQCAFSAIESQTPFRSARVAPKPVIQGPQTAMVVGPSSEEIYTDKYGRVKVQFHWDREGSSDENSSCWVRAAHVWAGKNWGGIHIPRIGQEVIVEFLEGDPDRPIITGRVYNADQMPPYELPANATQSGIKSRSSKDGAADNFNEIRFEDAKGSEEVYVHAEKDLTVMVENNETRTVDNDRTMEVKNNDTITIGADRTEKITGIEDRTVTGDVTELFQANESRQILGNLEEQIMGNEDRIITSNQTLTLTGNQTNTITGNQMETVTGTRTEMLASTLTQVITGGATIVTPATYTLVASGGFNLVAPSSDTIFKGTDFAVVGFKAEAVGMATGATGAKVEATGLADATTGVEISRTGVSLGVNGVEMSQAGIEIETKALKVIS